MIPTPLPHSWRDFGYLGIVGCVFLEQIGIPIPAFPVLLAGGALAANGELSLTICLLLAVGAAVAADSIWYQIGRVKGNKVLNFMCRLSWRADTCVSKVKTFFSRHGTRTLLFAKFVPGLSAMATPMAGITKVPFRRFLAYDAVGAILWASVPLFAGAYFRENLKSLRLHVPSLQIYLPWVCGLLIVAVLLWHYATRQRYLRDLRRSLIEGITVDDLKKSLDAGEDFFLVDVRDELSAQAHPVQLPGARWIPYHSIVTRVQELPAGKTIVVYCDCPIDQASGAMVELLAKQGIKKVRPLLGGLDGWIAKGFTTVDLITLIESSQPLNTQLKLEPST